MILNDCRADFESALGLSTDALQLGSGAAAAHSDFESWSTAKQWQALLAARLITLASWLEDSCVGQELSFSTAQGSVTELSYKVRADSSKSPLCLALRPGPRQPGAQGALSALSSPRDSKNLRTLSGGNIYLGPPMNLVPARSLAPEQVPKERLCRREPPHPRPLPRMLTGEVLLGNLFSHGEIGLAPCCCTCKNIFG